LDAAAKPAHTAHTTRTANASAVGLFFIVPFPFQNVYSPSSMPAALFISIPILPE